MIKGVHTMFYSSEPEALRAFLRDKLQLPCSDVGEGWLIFDAPEAEVGCHPADPEKGGHAGTHNISFYCDDVHKVVGQLRARGVEFIDAVADMGYGLVTSFKMPGGVTVQLYQPRYVKNPPPKPAAVEAAPPAARVAPRRKPAAKRPAKRPGKRPAVRIKKKVTKPVKKARRRR